VPLRASAHRPMPSACIHLRVMCWCVHASRSYQGVLQAHTDILFVLVWLLAGCPVVSPSTAGTQLSSAPAPSLAGPATPKPAAVGAGLSVTTAPTTLPLPTIPIRHALPGTITGVVDVLKAMTAPPCPTGQWQCLLPGTIKLATLCQCEPAFTRAHRRVQAGLDAVKGEFERLSAQAAGRSSSVAPLPGKLRFTLRWGSSSGVRCLCGVYSVFMRWLGGSDCAVVAPSFDCLHCTTPVGQQRPPCLTARRRVP
jgi:hypothetical protein